MISLWLAVVVMLPNCQGKFYKSVQKVSSTDSSIVQNVWITPDVSLIAEDKKEVVWQRDYNQMVLASTDQPKLKLVGQDAACFNIVLKKATQ